MVSRLDWKISASSSTISIWTAELRQERRSGLSILVEDIIMLVLRLQWLDDFVAARSHGRATGLGV